MTTHLLSFGHVMTMLHLYIICDHENVLCSQIFKSPASVALLFFVKSPKLRAGNKFSFEGVRCSVIVYDIPDHVFFLEAECLVFYSLAELALLCT